MRECYGCKQARETKKRRAAEGSAEGGGRALGGVGRCVGVGPALSAWFWPGHANITNNGNNANSTNKPTSLEVICWLVGGCWWKVGAAPTNGSAWGCVDCEGIREFVGVVGGQCSEGGCLDGEGKRAIQPLLQSLGGPAQEIVPIIGSGSLVC